MRERHEPIALQAYEALAERFARISDDNFFNACLERPATLSLLPDVQGKKILDAGCGGGFYAEWLLSRGAIVHAGSA